MVMVVSMLVACGEPDVEPCGPGKHTDKTPRDNVCDVCGERVERKPVTVGGIELPSVTWDETKLLFQMTHNSNREELSSGCEKYLAGESNEAGSIYTNVKERNRAAKDYAGVDVEYMYYEDTETYTWGKSITKMEESAKLTSEKGRPDMFCNFVYDMVYASLIGSFNNLYNDKISSEGVESGQLANYFQFAKNGAYDATYVDTGSGYMIEYMQSLTLSEHKMYLVASDYFIDLVRAFFVVPVNIELLNQIPASDDENAFNYDYNESGSYDIEDFYTLVDEQKWNYDAVKGFSKQIASPVDNAKDKLDGVWGFALAEGGLGASGILYTTSIVVIERENITLTDPVTKIPYQDYTFWYPDASEPLEEFCENLSSLFSPSTEGVVSVSGSTYGQSAEQAVRNRFSENFILFGGIICVGSLEEQEYKNMTGEGKSGFGVAPVPLYRTNYIDENTQQTKVDRYLTQIHNIGRVGAIAVKSNKFAQCTAFLNYQSLHSTDILNDYYNWTLKSDIAGDVAGNADMLDYIRENVRSSFDKAFEDAIGRHYLGSDSTYNQDKWHNMILDAHYLLSRADMHSAYDGIKDKKAGALKSLEEGYSGLP